MSEVPGHSWDDQDYESLQEEALAGCFESDDIEAPEIDCPRCWELLGIHICLACGHNPNCELTNCCHNYEKDETFGLKHDDDCDFCNLIECCRGTDAEKCRLCGHSKLCTERQCDEPSHTYGEIQRRVATSEELDLVLRLSRLREQKRQLEKDINKVRESLISSTFSTTRELFETPTSEKPMAWADYRESYSISSNKKSALEKKFPEVFREFFTFRETYTIFIMNPIGKGAFFRRQKPSK